MECPLFYINSKGTAESKPVCSSGLIFYLFRLASPFNGLKAICPFDNSRVKQASCCSISLRCGTAAAAVSTVPIW